MLEANFSSGKNSVQTAEIFQYDKGIQLCVKGLNNLNANTRFHFEKNKSEPAIVKKGVFSESNGSVTVIIPNAFLESAESFPKRVWIYSESGEYGKTEAEILIPVIARTRPEDYISQDDLANKTAIQRAVEEYFENNPIDKFEMSQNKTDIISNGQSTTADHENYPTVFAVREHTQAKSEDVEGYIDSEISSLDAAKVDKARTIAGINLQNDIPAENLKSALNIQNGKSAYELAVESGFIGTAEQWLASLSAPNPVVLPLSVYPTEAQAVEYMNSQQDKSVIYVWNNKIYTYTTYTVAGLSGACLYGYRNSASSGLVQAENRSTLIVPVSSFEAPLTIDYTGFAISANPYIYGGTSPTVLNKTLIANDGYVGRTDPITITAAQLQGCTYVALIISTSTKPSDFSITVNGTPVSMSVITSTSNIESAMGAGSKTVTGYADSGVEYASVISGNSQYLSSRNVNISPIPLKYCETNATYEAGTHYLTKYPYETMAAMFSELAVAHTEYVTETTLGQDASGVYDIKSYVLDAPSSLSEGQTSVISVEKPTVIITAGLHGVEPDAVHAVYHLMDDLCNHYMESEQLLYLRDSIRFVIVPISNPWGYVNQSYHNSNDVDINKNFEYGYRNNGSANTGTAAYSEAETQILKSVFDEYQNAVLHLECHGKYGEDTGYDKTIWFSLMQTLSSELLEITANEVNNLIGMRLKKLGYPTNNSTGGYITYYGLNGRPKDYTGTKYGMLSLTMEGTGKIYGESGYSVNTQKINCEAVENFILRLCG